jgi:hypothetical protein
MPTPDKDLMTRLAELVRKHGHQWKLISEIVSGEGYRDDRGNPFRKNALRKKMKRQETACRESSSKLSENAERARSEPAKPSEQSLPDIQEVARAVIPMLMQEGLLESAIREVLGSLAHLRQ